MNKPANRPAFRNSEQPRLGARERSGLPAWTYFNEEMLALERDLLFRRHWQLVCHASDIPNPGDYLCLDMVDERAVAIRGRDGIVRAFHNVCRHRGSRVVADQRGRCKGAIVCPFHGWSYDFEGDFRSAPRPDSLPPLDAKKHGLVPLEHELWNGFVFVRFLPGPQPSLATIMAPFADFFAAYRMDETKPLGRISSQEIPANWKSVRDVDNEGYHVPLAHPTLHDLYGKHYRDEPRVGWLWRASGRLNEGPGRHWSVRHYKKLRPANRHLPQADRDTWHYVGLFPNLVFMLYPEQIGFYQEWPLGVGACVQRSAYYGVPDKSREMALARYLVKRIDRQTGAEDTQLIIWSWEAMKSSAYAGIILSDQEITVRSYHDSLRQVLPVMNLDEEPGPGNVARRNVELRS